MSLSKKGASLIDKDIIAHCRERLAAFKCPKKVILLSRLPKNPSGKILKRELKEKFAAS